MKKWKNEKINNWKMKKWENEKNEKIDKIEKL
jgi:hypothetical protein